GELAKSFDISACSRDCPAPASGEAVVQLVPKTALAAVEHIALVVDPKAGRVRRSVVYDPLGNRTEYQFDDLQFGATVDDAKFAFTVPTGVSVLRAAADGSLAPKADPAAKPDAAKP
ncbi:MAG TPA: outer-membrane lipoprotein carrier protein LolA, partial [Myxococcota bacterium]|nr:outer-membrane lipoprotein carrier protein LolA [Myxococcota bacterium]